MAKKINLADVKKNRVIEGAIRYHSLGGVGGSVMAGSVCMLGR